MKYSLLVKYVVRHYGRQTEQNDQLQSLGLDSLVDCLKDLEFIEQPLRLLA